MLGVRSRDGNLVGNIGTKGFMRSKVSEAGELIAYLDDIVPRGTVNEFRSIEASLLLGRLKEEAIFTLVDHRHIFELGGLFGCELDMSEYPCLNQFINEGHPSYRCANDYMS